MRRRLPFFLSSILAGPVSFPGSVSRRMRLLAIAALGAAAFLIGPALSAQSADRVTQQVDNTRLRALPNHLPNWANSINLAGSVPANQSLDHLTVVLSRSPQQQLAIDNFLAAQQDSSSPDYHHWLTPTEVGERFGLSQQDIGAVTSWLQSQGLRVNWVSPSRMFISFGGAVSDVSRAFRTELLYYNIRGAQRMSVSSDPMIPEALIPAIKAIHGLYTIEDNPAHQMVAVPRASPEMTASDGSHFITPMDFRTIYDLPSSLNGAGVTIGIVGRSRTDFADFSNFENLAGSGFPNPTEIVPKAFGGIDPGPALTSPPAAGVSIGDQGEATLDVMRAGSVAPSAQLLLVVATKASGGIEADAQYLVQTSPAPAQVMTISFGDCESSAGKAGVDFWDTLFQQAAVEGISSFVSSGDSGASGCDAAFTTPPASPSANSPNYICSSGYATCVGGTEFADTGNPSLYWNSSNDSFLASARSYIPEGGWNEPLNGASTTVAASGGGVSSVIPTPTWQSGTGVPAARSGRYTPDVSFSASGHDGYFACFAAGGGSCVSSGGSWYYVYFAGTSAAAPSMAGVAALLDQDLGIAQGNLNPEMYQLATGMPSVFHDVTVATSSVTGCSVNTPSMCNNSIPSPTGLSGGKPGYLVTAGYDLVTGLGSLDVSNFISNFVGVKATPTLTVTPTQSNYTTAQTILPLVDVQGDAFTAPTGTVILTSGSFTSAPVILGNGYANFFLPAGTLPVGNDTLTSNYTPDAAAARYYNAASGSAQITITAVGIITPVVWVSPTGLNITLADTVQMYISLNGGSGNQAPSGSIVLTSGSYTSAPVQTLSGNAMINIPPNSLALGTDTITATYTPDAASASIYASASGSTVATVTQKPRIYPGMSVVPAQYTISNADPLPVLVSMSGVSGNPTPTGSVVLTAGSYTSTSTALIGGNASFTVPAKSMPPGQNFVSATYTPDAASLPTYLAYTLSASITVTDASKITPTVLVIPSSSTFTDAQQAPLTVTVSGGAGKPAPTGTVTLSSGSYSGVATLVAGSAAFTLSPRALAIGTDTLTASYTPDASGSSTYNPASGSGTVTITAATITAPVVTVTSSSSSVTTADAFSVTVTVSGGSGYQIPTGLITLTSGAFSINDYVLGSGGSSTLSLVGNSLAIGSDTITATYTPDQYSAPIYSSATGATTVTVSTPVVPSFTIAGTAVTVSPGATTGNSSTITVSSLNGFTGSVALAAVVYSSPAGAVNLPSLTFGATTPVSVTDSTPGTAKLTIGTSTGGGCTSVSLLNRGVPWYTKGGAIVACFLLFGIPARRRRQTILGMLALLAILTLGATACGSGGGSGACTVVVSGTTPGTYTVTVTGTSGSTTASGTFTVSVQ